MNITVNEELKAYIDPLTSDEHEALERSLLAEGCRDALVLWGDVLVDGHNRYGICQKHGLAFQTVQNTFFKSMDDVHLWMIDQHLGRRSVSDFQRGVLALRKREILAERRASSNAASNPHSDQTDSQTPTAALTSAVADSQPEPERLNSREDIAKAARLSSNQVVMIEKGQKQATTELVAAIKSGTISLNAAAAVATLPEEEQKAAVIAGKDELKQVAKRVRDAKRKPREEDSSSQAATDPDELQMLRQRVDELTAENEVLRRQISELQNSSTGKQVPW
jgi:tetrahydromethanopterin S-methyltransferase subunit G